MISKKYLRYLKSLVGIKTKSFDDILEEMSNVNFSAIHTGDIMRVDDGIRIKRDYLRNNYDVELHEKTLMSSDPTVLEVIIALAIRMEQEYVGEPNVTEIRVLFLRLLDNLGLLKTNDKVIMHDILIKFVNRAYKKNGVGGLFPLRHTTRDQRKLSLWSQMNEWIGENYIF